MSVFQRTDGRWVVKYKDKTGKTVQKTFKERLEAYVFDDELYQDSRKGSRLTVFEAVALYIKNKRLSKTCIDQYKWLVCGAKESQKKAKQKVGYAECIANKYVDELTRRDLEHVRDCCRAGGGKNITVNKWICRLKAAFSYAVSEDLVKTNPWEKYRALEEDHGSWKGTREKLDRIYAASPAWLQWIILTVYALCLRPGKTEMCDLKWSAFNFQRGSVTIHMGKVNTDKTVFPPDWYMREALARFQAGGSDRNGWVCPAANGGHLYRPVSAWRDACRKAGVRMPMYGIRHVSASEMVAAGADVAAVAANLGHASSVTTLTYYVHGMPQSQKCASAALAAPQKVRKGAENREKIQ